MKWLHRGTKVQANHDKGSARQSVGRELQYKAIWHDSGMSQSRLDQLAAYEMTAPWQRDGGDENKLKELQEKSQVASYVGALEAGTQPGKPIKASVHTSLRHYGTILISK